MNKVKNLETITQSEVCQKEKDKYHVHGIVQKVVIKTIPKKKKGKKAKWPSEEDLQIAEKRREAKAKEKGKEHPFECRVPKNSKER